MDYSNLTLRELYDKYSQLDNDKFPDEAKNLFEAIKQREKAERPVFTGKLSPRIIRFVAFSIDAVSVVFIFTLLFVLLYRNIFSLDYFKIFNADKNYIIVIYFISALVIALIYFLLNGYWLYKDGQSIGKKIMGIKIVDEKGKIPPLGITFGYRFLIMLFVSSLPLVGWILFIIEVLFIFGKKRKCLHDYIADTKVIFAGAEVFF